MDLLFKFYILSINVSIDVIAVLAPGLDTCGLGLGTREVSFVQHRGISAVLCISHHLTKGVWLIVRCIVYCENMII